MVSVNGGQGNPNEANVASLPVTSTHLSRLEWWSTNAIQCKIFFSDKMHDILRHWKIWDFRQNYSQTCPKGPAGRCLSTAEQIPARRILLQTLRQLNWPRLSNLNSKIFPKSTQNLIQTQLLASLIGQYSQNSTPKKHTRQTHNINQPTLLWIVSLTSRWDMNTTKGTNDNDTDHIVKLGNELPLYCTLGTSLGAKIDDFF